MVALTSRPTLYVILALVAAFVIVLSYLRVFSSVTVVALIAVLYVVMSIINRRKFSKQEKPKP